MVWYGMVWCTVAEPSSLHPLVYAVTAAMPREAIKETFAC
jgi:hypothetical protein